jgi:hypothetical protein
LDLPRQAPDGTQLSVSKLKACPFCGSLADVLLFLCVWEQWREAIHLSFVVGWLTPEARNLSLFKVSVRTFPCICPELVLLKDRFKSDMQDTSGPACYFIVSTSTNQEWLGTGEQPAGLHNGGARAVWCERACDAGPRPPQL